jgi:chromosome segregation ATPase
MCSEEAKEIEAEKEPHSEVKTSEARKFFWELNYNVNESQSEEKQLTSQYSEAVSDSVQELPVEESAVKSPFDLEVNVTQINEDSPSEQEADSSKVDLSEKGGIKNFIISNVLNSQKIFQLKKTVKLTGDPKGSILLPKTPPPVTLTLTCLF